MNKRALIVCEFLALAIVIYIASIGPAWWFVSKGQFSRPAFGQLYAPLAPLENHCPGDLLWRYENWWSPAIQF